MGLLPPQARHVAGLQLNLLTRLRHEQEKHARILKCVSLKTAEHGERGEVGLTPPPLPPPRRSCREFLLQETAAPGSDEALNEAGVASHVWTPLAGRS
jgi:hypothetical protein